MHNMCSVKTLEAVDRAEVGVLAFTAKDGSPRAVAVTPYVVDGAATVTTTLALLTKARMLRNRPTAALLAGGVHLSGHVDVTMHRDPAWFDANIRSAERRKYPPSAQLLGFPGHRRLLWWYVGRVSMRFTTPTWAEARGSDRVTITTLRNGVPDVTALAHDVDTTGEAIRLGATVPDGPACLLTHVETEGMAELLQETLRGTVRDGTLTVESRHGTLTPQEPGTLAQLRSLRALGRSARANRGIIEAW